MALERCCGVSGYLVFWVASLRPPKNNLCERCLKISLEQLVVSLSGDFKIENRKLTFYVP